MIMVATPTKLLPQTEPYSARNISSPALLDWSIAPASNSWEQLTTLKEEDLIPRQRHRTTFHHSDETLVPTEHEIKTLFFPELELPGSDGVPMENDRERLQINLGLESLDEHWKDRTDFFAGGNMFVYYSFRQAKDVIEEINGRKQGLTAFRGPDMFIVLNVDGSYRRQKWVTWKEDGHYPNVIFEFLSPSTRKDDLGKKKTLYEQTFKTEEYFCFDYFNPRGKDSLRGFRLVAGRYEPIKPNEKDWLWSEKLGLWVGTWQGAYNRDKTTWMRFYTEDADLVLIAAEAEQLRAESAQEKAEAEQLRAENAEEKAKAEQLRAENAEEKAKAAETEAEAAKAELAHLKALLAKRSIDLDA